MRIPTISSLLLVAVAAGLGAPPALAAPRAAAVDVPPLRTRYTPAELSAACEKAEKDADAKLAALVAIADAKRTFKDSFEGLDAILGDYNEAIARLSFMKDVHPQADVRDAGAACEERAGKWSVAVSARKDLYLAMKGFLDNAGKGVKLDDEQQRLVEITMRDFKRNGLELSDAPAGVAEDHAHVVRRIVLVVLGQVARERIEFAAQVDTVAELVSSGNLAGHPVHDLQRVEPDRSAGMHRELRHTELVVLRQQFLDRERRRTVDHEAVRSLVVVRADEHHRVREVRVEHVRRCGEQRAGLRAHLHHASSCTFSNARQERTG